MPRAFASLIQTFHSARLSWSLYVIMHKIAFALLLVLVVAEFALTGQVSLFVIVPLVFCGRQLFSPSTKSDELSPILKWGDGISTASICPDAFCRVTLPAVRVIRANHEIAISDFLRFVLGTIGVAAFQYVEIK